MAGLDRPFPPGDYAVVIIGSGPGGIQVAYSLRRLGVPYAILSEDPGPGGMFRRWPFFQRLLSWTKPHAPERRGTRAYERYDWNSLLGEEPETRAIQPGLMDGTSYFPSRPEMEANISTFASKAALEVRYGCTWTGTRRLEGSDEGAGNLRFAVETTDGVYRAGDVIVAVGVAKPFTPPTPGIELAHHYADVRPAETYAGRRVFIIGKQNSGFELANGLLPWARQLILSSPSPARLSVETKSLAGVRARYSQPFEDHALGGGVFILNAATERIRRTEGAESFTVELRQTDGGGQLVLEVDDVIAATGFAAPLVDLSSIGVQIAGRSGLPTLTPWWESTTVPGIWFAGTLGQAAKGLQKHGVPANSGAVHGARYNARLLAARLAATRHGFVAERPAVDQASLVDLVARELSDAPELWHQRAYLARIIGRDASGALVDDGVQPLAWFLDAGGDDALALTLEANGTGATYPVIYTRVGGTVAEHPIEPSPMMRHDSPEVRAAIASIVKGFGAG